MVMYCINIMKRKKVLNKQIREKKKLIQIFTCNRCGKISIPWRRVLPNHIKHLNKLDRVTQ